MEETFERAVAVAALVIEAAAALVLVCAAGQAFARLVRLAARGRIADAGQRAVWLGLARWLVLSLEFQLAADVLHTAVAPTWGEIGRVAALALIRTFLNYALEKDLEKAAERGEPVSGSLGGARAAAATPSKTGPAPAP